MNKNTPLAASAAMLALAVTAAPAAAADGHVTYLEAAGSADRPLVVAGSDRGVVFIGPDHTVFRAYHHRQTALEGADQPFLWVEDIDGDDRKEVVGAGTPSFVVDDNADPMWGIAEGCDRYFVGDFIDDTNAEVLCIRGATVAVWAFDGQEYFNWTGRGYSISACFGDDFDSDRKLEVACNLTNGDHLFFDIEEWFNDPNYDPPRTGPAPDAITRGGVDYSAVGATARGEQPLRVGAREVTLGFAGGALQLTTDGATATAQIGGSGIYSAIAADLDRDGRREIYVGGDDAVHVLSSDGTLIATVAANPDRATRDARVNLRSATANGLENSDREAVGAVVSEGLSEIQTCYAQRMGSDQFTRVGTMLWELSVDDGGRVSSASKRHSSLRNGPLESCVQGALEDLRFSPAESGSGSVSVALEFDFVDRI